MARPTIDNPKTEVIQIRLTPAEKEMLFYTAEEYSFNSVSEMIIEFIRLKYERLKRGAQVKNDYKKSSITKN